MFAYRLAGLLGVWDVEAMLDEMPARVFNGWMAAYAIDPWGGERGDLQAAYVGQAVLAPWTKHPKPPQPRAFLPAFAVQPQQRQDPRQQQKAFRAAARAFEQAIGRERARKGIADG